MVTQRCECTECHWMVDLKLIKMLNLLLSIFYHKKKKKKSDREPSSNPWKRRVPKFHPAPGIHVALGQSFCEWPRNDRSQRKQRPSPNPAKHATEACPLTRLLFVWGDSAPQLPAGGGSSGLSKAALPFDQKATEQTCCSLEHVIYWPWISFISKLEQYILQTSLKKDDFPQMTWFFSRCIKLNSFPSVHKIHIFKFDFILSLSPISSSMFCRICSFLWSSEYSWLKKYT